MNPNLGLQFEVFSLFTRRSLRLQNSLIFLETIQNHGWQKFHPWSLFQRFCFSDLETTRSRESPKEQGVQSLVPMTKFQLWARPKITMMLAVLLPELRSSVTPGHSKFSWFPDEDTLMITYDSAVWSILWNTIVAVIYVWLWVLKITDLLVLRSFHTFLLMALNDLFDLSAHVLRLLL